MVCANWIWWGRICQKVRAGVSSGAGPMCPHRWSPLPLLSSSVCSVRSSCDQLHNLLLLLAGGCQGQSHSDLSGLREVSQLFWERMRPNVPSEPAVRPDMGRLDCKVASGGQMEAGIHRWEGGHLVWMEDFGSHEQQPFVNVNVAELIQAVPDIP